MPRSRKQKGWMAISLGDKRVDLAHVCRNASGRPEVLTLDSYKETGSLSNTLERLRKSLNLSHCHCSTLLAPGEYQVLQVEAPTVSDGELRDALRWQVKEMLDFPAQEATVDVLQIPAEGGVGGRPKQVFAVAASNMLISGRMALFSDAKISLQVIDIIETAQRNISALLEDEGRGLALLVFGENGGLLTFTQNGELYAFRYIDVTLAQLMQSSGDDRARYLDRIALELQRSMDNFDRQFSYVTLSRLLVLPVPGLPDLPKQLGANLYVPVEPFDLARVFDFSSVPELKDLARQSQCLHLLGLALRDAKT